MKLFKELEEILKYNFKDKNLLKKALTHKSYSKDNNEKLEFLGDRVLGLIISKKLLEKFPDEKEGIIDKKFANLVNKKTCVSIGKKLNLNKYLYLGASQKNFERCVWDACGMRGDACGMRVICQGTFDLLSRCWLQIQHSCTYCCP